MSKNTRKTVCVYAVNTLNPVSESAAARTLLVMRCTAWDAYSEEETRRLSMQRTMSSTTGIGITRPDLVAKKAAAASAVSSASAGHVLSPTHFPRNRNFETFEFCIENVTVDIAVYKVVPLDTPDTEIDTALDFVSAQNKYEIHFKHVDKMPVLQQQQQQQQQQEQQTSVSFEALQLQALLPEDCDPSSQRRVWYLAQISCRRIVPEVLQELDNFYLSHGLVPFAAPDKDGRPHLDSHEVMWRIHSGMNVWSYYDISSTDLAIIRSSTVSLEAFHRIFKQPALLTSSKYEMFPLEFVVIRVHSEPETPSKVVYTEVYASHPELNSYLRATEATSRGLDIIMRRIQGVVSKNPTAAQLVAFERTATKPGGVFPVSMYRSAQGSSGFSACFDSVPREAISRYAPEQSIIYTEYYKNSMQEVTESQFTGDGLDVEGTFQLLKMAAGLSRITAAPFHVVLSHLSFMASNLQLATCMLTKEFLSVGIPTLPWPKTSRSDTKDDTSPTSYKGADILPSRPGYYSTKDEVCTLVEVDLQSAYPSMVCENKLCLRLSRAQLRQVQDTFDEQQTWDVVSGILPTLAKQLPLVATEAIKAPPAPAAKKAPAATATGSSSSSSASSPKAPEPVSPELQEARRQEAIRKQIRRIEEEIKLDDRADAVNNPAVELKSLPLSSCFARLIQSRRRAGDMKRLVALLKLGANVLYGAMGARFSRYYSNELAGAITACCRRNIRIYRFITSHIFAALDLEQLRQRAERTGAGADMASLHSEVRCDIIASPTDAVMFKIYGKSYRACEIDWVYKNLTRTFKSKWVKFGSPQLFKRIVVFTTNHHLIYPVSATQFKADFAVGTCINFKSTPPVAIQWLVHLYGLCLADQVSEDDIAAFLQKACTLDPETNEDTQAASVWFRAHLIRPTEYTSRLLVYTCPSVVERMTDLVGNADSILAHMRRDENDATRQFAEHERDVEISTKHRRLKADDTAVSSYEPSAKRQKLADEAELYGEVGRLFDESSLDGTGVMQFGAAETQKEHTAAGGQRVFRKWWSGMNLASHLGIQFTK